MAQGVKRIRGWQLDIETGKGLRSTLEEGGEKQEHSALASALLALWSHGKLSATMVQWLAWQAVLDGAQHDELVSMAKTGAYGSCPGNCHRDLMARFCKDVPLTKGEVVSVPAVDPKTGTTGPVDATVFLPHVVFSSLEEYELFPELFGLANLEKFWTQAEKTRDDRLTKHPLLKGPGWKLNTVPLFVHGDAAEFQTRDSLMIWSRFCP